MARDVVSHSAAARETFESADDALGFALSRICFEGPEEDLVRTEIQQPAILTTSIACLRALQEQMEFAPAFVAGHSLGEYSALVASGALGFEDAVRLVNARGRFMQEAVPEGRGAMAAVLGISPAEVEDACERARRELDGAVVTAANYNSPQQTVIAGEALAVDLACTRAREAGAKRTVALPVSAPFHCELMRPAADKLQLELARVAFSDPQPAVVTNVEATANAEGARIAALLEQQVTAPVRFTEMVQTLCEQGVTHFLEVGPGRVLGGLVARIQRRSKRASFGAAADLDEVLSFISGEEA
jgi:[acyl-carrier-protein] S-malonyltransferase